MKFSFLDDLSTVRSEFINYHHYFLNHYMTVACVHKRNFYFLSSFCVWSCQWGRVGGIIWRILIIYYNIITPPPTVIIMTLLRILPEKKFVFVTSRLFVLLRPSMTNIIIKGWTHHKVVTVACKVSSKCVKLSEKLFQQCHLLCFSVWCLMNIKIGI